MDMEADTPTNTHTHTHENTPVIFIDKQFSYGTRQSKYGRHLMDTQKK